MEYKSLVLGSSSGIGLAITKELLNLKQNVTAISRRNTPIDNKLLNHISIDVTDDNFITLINKKINLKDYNNLIYCVGTNKINHAIDYSKEDLDYLIRVNLIPAMLISFEFIKARDTSNPSSILFLGSIWSSYGIKGRSIYGATKSALTGFCKHLSSEVSSTGCLVNVLSPGFTDTALTKKTINDPLIKKMLERVKNKSLLTTKDIASHAISLVCPLNKCITGQEIFADGGFSSHG